MMGCASPFKLFWLTAFFTACMVPLNAARTPEAAATIVIFNNNDPDSKSLAQYYAKQRTIPSEQIIGLDCPTTEEISRTDYENKIANPLRQLFRKRDWWTIQDADGQKLIVTKTRIRFVAIIRGVPLKIVADPKIPPATFIPNLPAMVASRNEASVDSELATLGISVPEVAGILPNPYYRRFTSILEDPINAGILLPARLDAPTPDMVRAMIDDSISVERDGLWGWSYVDARNISSEGLKEGDDWMNNVVGLMRTHGLPVIFDNNPATFPEGYPITDAAIYYGWYAGDVEGPFADATFHFRPGAVAVHIHSFSASTLRSITSNWCGPLIARGAAATLGNVYEPYLVFTANLDVFQDRLMTGFTLAESAYMSQRALSWMGTVVGDPLYRPYASWQDITKKNPRSWTSWQVFRNIILKWDGKILKAASALKETADKMKNSMFFEALGGAQFDDKQFEEALTSFEGAIALKPDPPILFRLNLEKIATLLALGRKDDALTFGNSMAAQCQPGTRQNLFLRLSGNPTPTPPQTSPTPDSSHLR